jgi:DNA-binding transcriptional LysR family regulator
MATHWLNIHQLHIFYQVAKQRSFSKAGQALGISQPSISIQIKNLEHALGTHLIDRTGRHISLSLAGQILLEHADQLFDLMSKIQTDLSLIKGMKKGSLILGSSTTPSSTVLPSAISSFKKQFPEIHIRLKVGRSEEVEKWVIENEVDLAVMVGEPVSSKIVKELLLEDEMLVVLPAGHSLARKRSLLLKDLAQERLILPGPGKLKSVIDAAFASRGIKPSEQMYLGDRDATKAAVNAGLGISVMPRLTVERDAETHFVVTRKIEDKTLRYPINIVYRKEKHFSQLALACLEVLRQRRARSVTSAYVAASAASKKSRRSDL